MKFQKTPLNGCFLIDLEPQNDMRGSFTRLFCQSAFRKAGIEFKPEQCNLSVNAEKGTLRGLHYQVSPFEEAKIVWCTSGTIHDVILDLRKDSPTYKKFAAFEMSENSHQVLYIPKGFAHGYLTLTENVSIFYWMSASYEEKSARGIRWNDPAFQISWPKVGKPIISERDKKYPDFKESA